MMKMHVVIATLMIAFGGMQLANAAASVHSAMYSPQMQHLSQRPYQASKPATAAADTAWQDATFRGYDRQSQQTFKLHALAKRSF